MNASSACPALSVIRGALLLSLLAVDPGSANGGGPVPGGLSLFTTPAERVLLDAIDPLLPDESHHVRKAPEPRAGAGAGADRRAVVVTPARGSATVRGRLGVQRIVDGVPVKEVRP